MHLFSVILGRPSGVLGAAQGNIHFGSKGKGRKASAILTHVNTSPVLGAPTTALQQQVQQQQPAQQQPVGASNGVNVVMATPGTQTMTRRNTVELKKAASKVIFRFLCNLNVSDFNRFHDFVLRRRHLVQIRL